jgi:5-methylcytosine-specific restriction endonuclease McrBC regulatory subunit McrC
VSINVAAAPMGARVGLSTARLGDQQVVVSVSPKAWRPPGPKQLRLSGHDWGSHTQLDLYETERLQLDETDAEVETLTWGLLGASRRLENGGPSWDSSLLAPDVPFRRGSTPSQFPPRDQNDQVADVLRLFDRVDLLRTSEEALLGGSSRSPLHQPLLYRRFLDAVASQVATVRPGYRRVSEAKSTIRGRVDAADIALWRKGGTARLRCTFDQLTLSTDLLGCICAALEWIADARGAGSRLPGEFSDVRLRHDAVMLRRVLSEVVAPIPRDALAIGRKLRLSRLDQAWTESLRLAILTLSQVEVLASEAQLISVTAVELSVPTDKLWERIVTDALHRAGFESVIPQARALTSDPWIKSPKAFSHTYPDNVARQKSNVFIVDAKYKTPQEGASPSRDDQYQMFAYSHLVRDLPRSVRAAVLVYPGLSERAQWIRGRDEHSARPVELFAVQMPFPSPAEVRAPHLWARYLTRAGARLAGELGIVEQNLEVLTA